MIRLYTFVGSNLMPDEKTIFRSKYEKLVRLYAKFYRKYFLRGRPLFIQFSDGKIEAIVPWLINDDRETVSQISDFEEGRSDVLEIKENMFSGTSNTGGHFSSKVAEPLPIPENILEAEIEDRMYAANTPLRLVPERTEQFEQKVEEVLKSTKVSSGGIILP